MTAQTRGAALAALAAVPKQVIWTLSVKRLDDKSCEYTSSVVAHPDCGLHEIHRRAQGELRGAATGRQRDGGDHNRRATPLFAASIERKARATPSARQASRQHSSFAPKAVARASRPPPPFAPGYAGVGAALRDTLWPAKTSAAKPSSIIAQVEGSGTVGTELPVMQAWGSLQ
jgi:hypothetical protein